MKKIGIITIIDYKNYGNRLQNYATQEVLKSLSCEVTTIINKPIAPIQTKESILGRIRQKRLWDLVKSVAGIIKSMILNRTTRKSRIAVFKKFSKDYINETDFCITQDNIPEGLANAYDYFITGSDQIWNPIFRGGSAVDFLTFAPKYKRIAYAPSFGISQIPDEYKDRYKEWIEDIAHLSVREQAGAEIIRELTGRDAEVLVDPTLMLSKKEWNRISSPSKYKPNREYLLTYFLGYVSKESRTEIKNIAIDNNLKIIHLANLKDLRRYSSAPSEFIDYIKSAEIILTDSYHGAIFSIIFEKPFVVFNRVGTSPSMSSRIDTLLAKFKLDDRRWEIIKNAENYFDIDFSHVHPILEAERKKARDFLKYALGIIYDD